VRSRNTRFHREPKSGVIGTGWHKAGANRRDDARWRERRWSDARHGSGDNIRPNTWSNKVGMGQARYDSGASSGATTQRSEADTRQSGGAGKRFYKCLYRGPKN
jgi:hypothetical protein